MDQHTSTIKVGYVRLPLCQEAWMLRGARDRLVVQVVPPANVKEMNNRQIDSFIDWEKIRKGKNTPEYKAANDALEAHMEKCEVCQSNLAAALVAGMRIEVEV